MMWFHFRTTQRSSIPTRHPYAAARLITTVNTQKTSLPLYLSTSPNHTNSLKCRFSCPSVYCVGLNTFFASVFPLLSLLYLNIKTLSALKRLIKERTSQGMELASLVSVTANPVSGHVLTVGGHQDIESKYLGSLDLLNDIFWILVLISYLS